MKFLRLIGADEIILALVCLTAFLYGGEWIYNRAFRPVIYKPPPGMLYLGAVPNPLRFAYPLPCEGCVPKQK